VWAEHFAWSPDGAVIIGRTPIGRATNEFIVNTRRFWVEAGRWPPMEDPALGRG